MRTYSRYVSKVLSNIECSSQLRKRLKEDLLSDLYNRSEVEGITDPDKLMGSPKDVALEIIGNHNLKLSSGYEYISETTLFGLPLVHISTKQQGVAVGIIAVGIKSVGLFSCGILSLGLVSIGVVTAGLLLAIGTVTLSALLSMGAVAISGAMSLGAIAISKNISIGAIAVGKIAIGVRAYGELAIFSEFGRGDTIINMKTQRDLIEPAIRSMYDSEGIRNVLLRTLYLKK